MLELGGRNRLYLPALSWSTASPRARENDWPGVKHWVKGSSCSISESGSSLKHVGAGGEEHC